MRLGTNLPYQSPPGKICGVFEGSDHMAGPDDLLDAFGKLRQLGFEHVELGADMFMYDAALMSGRFMERLGEKQRQLGLSVSLHLSEHFGIMLESLDEDVRRASVTSSLKAIRAVRPLDVQHVVVHINGAWPWATLILDDDPEFPKNSKVKLMERIVEQSRKSLHALIKEVPARTICLENLLTEFQGTAQLAEEFDTSLCFDGGHWARTGRPLVEFVEEYGDRIGLVHCHDVRHSVDHRPLSTGPDDTPVLEWEAAFKALADKEFDGPVVLELYGLDNKVQSLKYLQRLRRIYER
jgi:sugar phosphate isomerase/epimerase